MRGKATGEASPQGLTAPETSFYTSFTFFYRPHAGSGFSRLHLCCMVSLNLLKPCISTYLLFCSASNGLFPAHGRPMPDAGCRMLRSPGPPA